MGRNWECQQKIQFKLDSATSLPRPSAALSTTHLPIAIMLKLCCNYNGFQSALSLRFKTLLPPYSTSLTTRASHFMVDYLVNSLGFAREEATLTSEKVGRLKSSETSDSLINFLEKDGFDKSQIRKIISLYPKLLLSDVDKTLKPKIRVFQELGFSGSEFVDVIAANPSIVSRGLCTHILPSINFLKSILGSDENVVNAIKRSNWLLSAHITRKLQPNMLLLKKYGISNERIQKFIVQNPRYLLHNPKCLEESLVRVEEVLGIPRYSKMFLYGVDAIASLSKRTLEMKFRLFRSYGWTDSEVLTMARRLPHCLKLSAAKIRSGLGFFMKELGYKPVYLATHPKLLMHSMEKRVLPRNAVLEVLKEMKLIGNPSLCTVVSLTESQFKNLFVLPYKDKLPKLYEAYIKNKMDLLNGDAIAN
ncbi:hypothetical protein Ancab_032817 [Ancistrocladus abbreviatus]